MDGVTVIIFLGLCIWVGVAADNRGRSGILWFIISLIISPLLGGLFVALSENLKTKENIKKVKMESQQLKDRVVSNEKINEFRLSRAENDIEKLASSSVSSKIENMEVQRIGNDTKSCPFCSEKIKATAIKCKHCGSMLNEKNTIECPFCKEDIYKDDLVCKHCKTELASEKS